jgi:hypothetical protein
MPMLLEKHIFIKSRLKTKTFYFGHKKIYTSQIALKLYHIRQSKFFQPSHSKFTLGL